VKAVLCLVLGMYCPLKMSPAVDELPETDPIRYEYEHSEYGNEKVHKVGDTVTCIYVAIYSWDNGDEFPKTVPMKCKVLEVSKHSPQIKIDCRKDLKTQWSDRPGHGMVKNHDLNKTVSWSANASCYESI
jgi:hypothetical protein